MVDEPIYEVWCQPEDKKKSSYKVATYHSLDEAQNRIKGQELTDGNFDFYNIRRG